eukprot:CAMPEP_0206026562 /NCGR_PEP_ID=MMETSP1464-20131121/41872_1 /ASSEMBLY_ACC=CAM_ASM_001124 /TAXON_ID=119497 /ORGANISM="Exanthemachrysis gayraliae, Strain RCC1523" /LENGTH=568 /DNA_ID=CAMNT_0053400607 /DNA_START=30 /DNA_END=1733 /DNA_ORIENTATION=+
MVSVDLDALVQKLPDAARDFAEMPGRVTVAMSRLVNEFAVGLRRSTEDAGRKPRVFISYATGYRPGVDEKQGVGPGMLLACRLMVALRRDGIDVYSGLHLESGEKFDEEFFRGLQSSCDVLLVVYTKAIFESKVCLQEIFEALELPGGVSVKPIIFEEAAVQVDDEDKWPHVHRMHEHLHMWQRVVDAMKAVHRFPEQGCMDGADAMRNLLDDIKTTLNKAAERHAERRRATEAVGVFVALSDPGAPLGVVVPRRDPGAPLGVVDAVGGNGGVDDAELMARPTRLLALECAAALGDLFRTAGPPLTGAPCLVADGDCIAHLRKGIADGKLGCLVWSAEGFGLAATDPLLQTLSSERALLPLVVVLLVHCGARRLANRLRRLGVRRVVWADADVQRLGAGATRALLLAALGLDAGEARAGEVWAQRLGEFKITGGLLGEGVRIEAGNYASVPQPEPWWTRLACHEDLRVYAADVPRLADVRGYLEGRGTSGSPGGYSLRAPVHVLIDPKGVSGLRARALAFSAVCAVAVDPVTKPGFCSRVASLQDLDAIRQPASSRALLWVDIDDDGE